MIHRTVKHGFVSDQFILWHDMDFSTIQIDGIGACEIYDLWLPALVAAVVEARVGGGIAEFDPDIVILKGHVDKVPGIAFVRQGLEYNIRLHLLYCRLRLLHRHVDIDIDQRTRCPIGFSGQAADDLVRDVVTVKQRNDPVERLSNLLWIIGYFHSDGSFLSCYQQGHYCRY